MAILPFPLFLVSRFPWRLGRKQRSIGNKTTVLIEELEITYVIVAEGNVETTNQVESPRPANGATSGMETSSSWIMLVPISQHSWWDVETQISAVIPPSRPVTVTSESSHEEEVPQPIPDLLQVVSPGSHSQRNRQSLFSMLAQRCMDPDAACRYYAKFRSIFNLRLSLVDFLRGLTDASLTCYEDTGKHPFLECSLSFIIKSKKVLSDLLAQEDSDAGTEMIIDALIRLCHTESMALLKRYAFVDLDQTPDVPRAPLVPYWQGAVALISSTAAQHEAKANHFTCLSNALLARFECLDNIAELDGTITALRQAIQLMHDASFDKPGLLNRLGKLLLTRFERLGDMADIQDAILSHRRGLQLSG